MTVKCILCEKEWDKPSQNNGISSSLCPKCLTPIIREIQKRKGYHDCFGRATEPCSRECRLKSLCCGGL